MWPLEAPQDSLDPGDQLARREGLSDVVVGAHLQAMHAVVFRSASCQEDDGYDAQRGVLAQPAAEVKAIAARHHDIQQKQRRRLPLGIGKNLTDRQIGANGKTGALQVVLDQPGDIRVVFQHKNRLTQFVNLDLATQLLPFIRLAPPDGTVCKRTMNRDRKPV